MKFSEVWLREWVNPEVGHEQLLQQLTMAGLEVEGVEVLGEGLDHVVVGRVDSIEPHPNADKLKVCSVDVGGYEKLQIVCGASNVVEGMRVPTALVGASLPNGLKIKKAKLRGVASSGMLCSTEELGLEESAEGLMPLPGDAPVGQPVVEYLALNDRVVELSITPNRGDCLSILGIAREVGVLNRLALKALDGKEVQPEIDDRVDIDVKQPQGCPRYLGRVIKGINPQAQTPLWMQERLRRCGLRPLHPVVDVTNYVLVELGQPMHAFDLAKLNQKIIVDMASEGEKAQLLDGREAKLDADMLTIRDADGVVALAGIMGGEESAVGDETTDIFLECAFFDLDTIAGRARRLGMHTDSSQRFERGVDPDLAPLAMAYATRLLLDIVGGQVGPVSEAKSDEHMPQREAITLRRQRLDQVLGHHVSDQEVSEMFERLGMPAKFENQSWILTAPGCRFDINLEEDLIEEVARIHGYANFPSERPQVRIAPPKKLETETTLSEIKQVVVDRDYHEVITYSFVDPDLQKYFDKEDKGIALLNPIASDMAVMRTSLWPGLLNTLMHNAKRQQKRIRLFEMGTVFEALEEGKRETLQLAGMAYGASAPEQWASVERAVDFFDVKGDVEALLALTADAHEFEFAAAERHALHPGMTAVIRHQGRDVGYVGALHPRLLKAVDAPEPVFVFQIEVASLATSKLPRFEPLSKFPAIRRDIALVIDEAQPVEALMSAIRASDDNWLRNLTLFDVYQGKGVDSGKKSVALGLTLQTTSSTLTDEDVDAWLDRVLAVVKAKFGATLRE